MMAPAARPPMMPAATAPPRACAGCVGVTITAALNVAAAAMAVTVLVNLVMRTSSWFVCEPLNKTAGEKVSCAEVSAQGAQQRAQRQLCRGGDVPIFAVN